MMGAITVQRRATAGIVVTAAAGLTVALTLPDPPPVAEAQIVTVGVIASPAQVPVPTVARGAASIAPAALASPAVVPTPTIQPGPVALRPTAIASPAQVPAPLVQAGPVSIVPSIVASPATVPTPSVQPGAVSIAPPAIAAVATVPSPTLQTGASSVSPTVIASLAVVPIPAVQAGAVNILPAAIASDAVVPAPVVSQPAAAYDTDAQAAFAAMTVQPNAARKTLYSNMIAGLKADGVWNLIEFLAIPAAHDSQAGRLDLRNPTRSLAAINSPIFTVDRGYTGDGSGAYLDTAINYNAFTLATQNDQHWLAAVFAAPSVGSSQWALGVAATGGAIGLLFNTAAQTILRIGAATSYTLNDSVKPGRYLANRQSSAGFDVYKNGSNVATATAASTARNGAPVTLLRFSGNYATATVSAFSIGASLTATQAAALDSRINTFLIAIGAVP